MRYMLIDELWAAMEPLVRAAKTHRVGQPPALSEELFFEAALYLARTGVPLRDLPGEFGEWDAVYNRWRRCGRSGAMNRLFKGMTADPQFGQVRRVLVDSTVRAHQAAGVVRANATGDGQLSSRAVRISCAVARAAARFAVHLPPQADTALAEVQAVRLPRR